MASNGKTITDVADDVVGKAKRSARKAADVAEHAYHDAESEIVELAGKAGTATRSAATSGKDMAADAVHGLADAARQLADKLADGPADSGNAKAADMARKLADGMTRFSDNLKQKEIDEIAEDARSVVRDHPAIAVGAAAVIGFALARFLKGSSAGDDAA